MPNKFNDAPDAAERLLAPVKLTAVFIVEAPCDVPLVELYPAKVTLPLDTLTVALFNVTYAVFVALPTV